MTRTRIVTQAAFLVLIVTGVYLMRGNAERWCPFGGVEALYTYLAQGDMVCSLAVSNFYILAGVLVATLLLRRAFCGYACPIGALSEWVRAAGRKLGIARKAPGGVRVPPRLDAVLSLLKYAVLALILWFTWRAGELFFRGYDPCYALISRHGEDITVWAYVVSGAIVVGSLLVSVPFCRWLCPLAAVLNPFSRFALLRVRRDEGACIDCGMCARACPMAIPVDEMHQVKQARCTACLECVGACPERDAGALVFGGAAVAAAHPAPARGLSQPVLVAVLLVALSASVAASYLCPLPSFVHARGEKPAETRQLELEIENLSCRGKATLLTYFLDRDDELEIAGYLEIEAWPGPGAAAARITYDPANADDEAIKMAITEPYYDALADLWRVPPFNIVGYDPLGLGTPIDEGR